MSLVNSIQGIMKLGDALSGAVKRVVNKANFADDLQHVHQSGANASGVPKWVLTVESWGSVPSFPQAKLGKYTTPRMSVANFSPSSAAEKSSCTPPKKSAGLIQRLRDFFTGAKNPKETETAPWVRTVESWGPSVPRFPPARLREQAFPVIDSSMPDWEETRAGLISPFHYDFENASFRTSSPLPLRRSSQESILSLDDSDKWSAEDDDVPAELCTAIASIRTVIKRYEGTAWKEQAKDLLQKVQSEATINLQSAIDMAHGGLKSIDETPHHRADSLVSHPDSYEEFLI